MFPGKCCDFSELCKFCSSAGVWPAIVYTHWHRGETERGQSPEYNSRSSKNTIFNDHPVYIYFLIFHTIYHIHLFQLNCKRGFPWKCNFPVFLGHSDQSTNHPMDMRGHREVTLQITTGCSLNIVFFPIILKSLPPIPC